MMKTIKILRISTAFLLCCMGLTGYAQITSLSLENGLRMDVHYGRTDPGTMIKSENNNDEKQPPYSKAQHFDLLSNIGHGGLVTSEYLGEGYYEYLHLRTVLDGEARYVSVENDNATLLGSRIELSKYPGKHAQWDFQPAGDGYYYIRARKKFRGYVPLYINSATKRGKQLYLGYAKQKWKLKPILPEGNVMLVVRLKEIKTPVHNNDCRKIEGRFSTSLRVINGRPEFAFTRNEGLVEWPGKGPHGSIKWSFESDDIYPGEVRYIVEKSDVLNGNLQLSVCANNLDRCHKSCDLCTDYNCDIDYGGNECKNLSSRHFGNLAPYTSTVTFHPKENNGNKHPITLTIETHVEY